MKNLISLIIVFIPSFCLHISLQAQKNYVKALLINYQNDTLYGQIHLKTIFDHEKIHFLENNSESPMLYKPDEIKKIKTDNKCYVAKEVSIDSQKKTIFLELLFEGYINGYFLNNHNFFIEKDDSIFQLSIIEKEVLKESDGKKYMMESKQYLGTLNYIFYDEPDLVKEFANNRLSSQLLTRFFRQYHHKKYPETDFLDYSKKNRYMVHIEPQFGLEVVIPGFQKLFDFSAFFAPEAGLNFHLSSLQNHRWDFVIGINYSPVNFKADYNHSIFNKEETYRLTLKYSSLQIPFMIEYSLNRKKIQPIVRFGYNNILIVKQDNYLENVIMNDSGDEMYIIPKASDMRNYQFGIMAGGGIKLLTINNSNLKLCGIFEFRAPFINTHYFMDKQKNCVFQLSLGYSFRLR